MGARLEEHMAVPERASWDAVRRRLGEVRPEAFGADGPANLVDGSSDDAGAPGDRYSPVDGSRLGALPKPDSEAGAVAVEAAPATRTPLEGPVSNIASWNDGRGESWKGAFVGGELIARALTEGPPAENLFGNFPSYQRLPAA